MKKIENYAAGSAHPYIFSELIFDEEQNPVELSLMPTRGTEAYRINLFAVTWNKNNVESLGNIKRLYKKSIGIVLSEGKITKTLDFKAPANTPVLYVLAYSDRVGVNDGNIYYTSMSHPDLSGASVIGMADTDGWFSDPYILENKDEFVAHIHELFKIMQDAEVTQLLDES